MTHRIAVLALLAGLALAAPALATDYPPAGPPGAVSKPPPGKHRTIAVCEHNRGHGCFPRIQDAVDEARAGDTVVVPDGTYKEAVLVRGAKKRYLRLIGNTEDPGRVVLEGGSKRQNGVLVDGADQVTVMGFTVRHYRGNGIFIRNAAGYHVRHVVATLTGTYGVYAFNTTGGIIEDSEASYNNDSGFYIGQTPRQTRPFRSIVRRVKAWGNVLGFSGTNMRYVTITRSQWFNNGVGIVPNALDSEKYAPPEDNVISDNDVFWNNFNYFLKAPFPLRKGATGEVAYPVGTGILLFGGRRNLIERNRVYGNYLFGVGAVQQFLLKQADARDLVGNRVRDNVFGGGGADLNGRDLFYDGNGSDNCFGPNTGVQVTVPADGSTFTPCPFSGPNAFSSAAQQEVVSWALEPDHEAHWIKHPHAAKAGYTPLEHYAP